MLKAEMMTESSKRTPVATFLETKLAHKRKQQQPNAISDLSEL